METRFLGRTASGQRAVREEIVGRWLKRRSRDDLVIAGERLQAIRC